MENKKICSLLTLIILIFNLIYPVISIATEGVETGNKTIYINNGEELWNFAGRVNGGENFEGYTIELTNDIDLKCSESKSWIPIGKNKDYPFKGIFDGKNFSIENMYIYKNEEIYNGLFGYVEDAKIENVIINGEISVDYKETFDKNEGTWISGCIGSIAGTSVETQINNCISNVQINGITSNSEVNWSWNVGGIVGINKARVFYENNNNVICKCINNGKINVQGRNGGAVGGIAGYNYSGKIRKSVNMR